jgi:hypothetical protein
MQKIRWNDFPVYPFLSTKRKALISTFFTPLFCSFRSLSLKMGRSWSRLALWFFAISARANAAHHLITVVLAGSSDIFLSRCGMALADWAG